MTDLDHAVNAARVDGRRWLDRRLDKLCTNNGLDPWQAWRRPRGQERIDQLRASHAAVRQGVSVQSAAFLPRPRRDSRGRFLPRVAS